MDYLTYRWTTHGITILYIYISVDLAYHKIFRAKVGKGGIKQEVQFSIRRAKREYSLGRCVILSSIKMTLRWHASQYQHCHQ